jgi:hypothetical protein
MEQKDIFYHIAQYVTDERDLLFISKEYYQLARELPDIIKWRSHWQGENIRKFIIMHGSSKMAELIIPVGHDMNDAIAHGNINVINKWLDTYSYNLAAFTHMFIPAAFRCYRSELAKHFMNYLNFSRNEVVTLLRSYGILSGDIELFLREE